jgi:hypothetical protein
MRRKKDTAAAAAGNHPHDVEALERVMEALDADVRASTRPARS